MFEDNAKVFNDVKIPHACQFTRSTTPVKVVTLIAMPQYVTSLRFTSLIQDTLCTELGTSSDRQLGERNSVMSAILSASCDIVIQTDRERH